MHASSNHIVQDLDMLMTRESPTEVPQYFVTHFSEGGAVRTERRISDFPHPYPSVWSGQQSQQRLQYSATLVLTCCVVRCMVT